MCTENIFTQLRARDTRENKFYFFCYFKAHWICEFCHNRTIITASANKSSVFLHSIFSFFKFTSSTCYFIMLKNLQINLHIIRSSNNIKGKCDEEETKGDDEKTHPHFEIINWMKNILFTFKIAFYLFAYLMFSFFNVYLTFKLCFI